MLSPLKHTYLDSVVAVRLVAGEPTRVLLDDLHALSLDGDHCSSQADLLWGRLKAESSLKFEVLNHQSKLQQASQGRK